MTDKVQKIREEVEKLKLCTMDEHMKFYSESAEAEYYALCKVEEIIDSLQEEPKFKTGDRIKPVDSCLGSPRTIVDICNSWYVTDQGTLDFEYGDNWEAVEEPKPKFRKGDKVIYLNEEYVVEDITDHYILRSTRERTSVPVVHVGFGNEDYELRLVEEPVSEDLEKAARSYTNNIDNIGGSVGEQTRNAFKAGAEWQKAKDESTTEDLGEYINELSKQFPEVSFAKLSRIAVRVAKWQEQKYKEALNIYLNSQWNKGK